MAHVHVPHKKKLSAVSAIFAINKDNESETMVRKCRT